MFMSVRVCEYISLSNMSRVLFASILSASMSSLCPPPNPPPPHTHTHTHTHTQTHTHTHTHLYDSACLYCFVVFQCEKFQFSADSSVNAGQQMAVKCRCRFMKVSLLWDFNVPSIIQDLSEKEEYVGALDTPKRPPFPNNPYFVLSLIDFGQLKVR